MRLLTAGPGCVAAVLACHEGSAFDLLCGVALEEAMELADARDRPVRYLVAAKSRLERYVRFLILMCV